ncbi:DUF6093 family protein [Sanguibacter sp. Z1732]|uniref:DUF6093 family protein n=1 Tax=Sanguibacter sp. Z1732 TaxID=3435412 RepID=UPI003D9CAC3F
MSAALYSGRIAAERLMTDQCVIRRPTGNMVTDPETFEDVPELIVIYDPRQGPHFGKCKVQSHEAFEQERESAGLTQIINRVRVDIPVGVARIMPEDVITILDSIDPLLIGQSYRVTVEAPYATHKTAYRIAVELNVGLEVPPFNPN